MQSDICQLKETLRNQIRDHLKGFSLESEKIAEKVQKLVLASKLFKDAKTIALYHPIQNEVQTGMIFEQAKLSHKKVAYPKIKKEGEALHFYWVHSFDQFSKNQKGLREPDEKLGAQKFPLSELELMLIPGLAFDREGWRLGRGKGFYDRTLKNFEGQRLGLGYSFQVLSHIPHEFWDEKLNWLATENELMKL